jgi:poly-gamma-glutamate capsule biosynthesis protein CapA/YwtB (metallophosphatase superfamily)
MPDQVNPQITDAITQTNTKVLAEAPAQAMAMAYQMLAQAVGHSMQNATMTQQNVQTIASAATAKAVELITKIGAS